VWSILDESVLYGSAAEPAVMRQQLDHLVKLSELPNVTILVLRWALDPRGSHGTLRSSPSPSRGRPAVAYTDGMLQGSYYEDPSAVLRYRNALTRLNNGADSPEDSLARIRRRLKELS